MWFPTGEGDETEKCKLCALKSTRKPQAGLSHCHCAEPPDVTSERTKLSFATGSDHVPF